MSDGLDLQIASWHLTFGDLDKSAMLSGNPDAARRLNISNNFKSHQVPLLD